jgi:uncharacterized protein YgfB (UPF0149 family)
MPVLHSMFAKTAEHAVLLVLVQAPAGSRSDVWLQLLEECAKDQPAQPAVISCMLRQLQQAVEQAVRLEQQLAAAEGRVQQQEQQLAEQTVRLEQQGRQLAAAQGRLQALEGQLRELLAGQRQ